MRAFAQMMALPLFTATFGHLQHSLRTGSPALEQVAPEGLWPYLQAHPTQAEIFGQAIALTHPKGPRSGFVASRGKVRVGRVAAPVT